MSLENNFLYLSSKMVIKTTPSNQISILIGSNKKWNNFGRDKIESYSKNSDI